mmetsp:Transcript_118791/g.222079  ORF Transcript_118791/g.222079 Transcript_118791/m.222079 type:complete len:98 (-) Transcript_118791:27-320(-)
MTAVASSGEEESTYMGAAAAAVGTGLYNTGSFVGNTVVGTGAGLAGYEQPKKDGYVEHESWGKYMGYKVGGAVYSVFGRIASGLYEMLRCSNSRKDD